MSASIEIWSAGNAELGESPVWDSESQSLWWVDILRGAVLNQSKAGSAPIEYVLNTTVGAACLEEGGGLILATSDGFRSFDPASGASTVLAEVEFGLPDNRMNDGKVDPSGCFWAGTMNAAGEPGFGSLYRLAPDGSVARVLTELSVSNGLGWSPDGHTMYHIDTPTRKIRAFEFEPNTPQLGESRVFVDVSYFHGTPDGLCVDEEGFVWVCFWGGGFIRRFDPNGRFVRQILLPVTNPTSCCFGGAALDELFVTTATYGLTSSRRLSEPMAGSVLRLETGVRGMPSPRYRRDNNV